MRASIRRKGRHYHHPEGNTASALVKGRFLEPWAVTMAREWRRRELNRLTKLNIFISTRSMDSRTLTNKERHLLHSLQAEFKGAQNG